MRLGIVFLLISLILGGYAAWQTKEKLNNEEQKFTECFLRTNKFIAKGETITAGTKKGIYTRECFTKAARMDQIAVADTPADKEWLEERSAVVNIEEGVLLLKQFFVPADSIAFDLDQIQKGKRAITISVTELSSVGQFIDPGSRVDILGVFETIRKVPYGKEGEEYDVTESKVATILQSVEVIAAGRVTSEGGTRQLREQGGGYRTVTLQVTPEDAELLVMAKAQSAVGLVLTLRRKDETNPVPIVSRDFEALIRATAE